MAVYLFAAFMVLLVGASVGQHNHKKGIVLFIFLISFLFFALRYRTVGADTPVYWSMYSEFASHSWEWVLTGQRFEIGYSIFCKLLTYISKNPQTLLIASGAFISSCVSWFIYKYSKDVTLSGFLWFVLCIGDALNIMRGYMAFSILLIAIDRLICGSKKKFLLWVLLATTFHNVALVSLIFLLPINSGKKYKKMLAKGITISAVAFLFFNTMVSIGVAIFPQYRYYLTSVWGKSNYLGSFVNILTYGLLWIVGTQYLNRGQEEDVKSAQTNYFLFNAMQYAFLFSLLTMRMTIFNRVAVLFSPLSIIWTPLFLSNIKKKQERKFVAYCIAGASLSVFCVISVLRPEWTGAIPYRFFWEAR